MARPSTYHDGIPDLVREYVKNHESQGELLPTVEGLALYAKIPRSTLYVWAKDPEKSDFLDTLEELKALQAMKLLNNGLAGEYNSTIAKLMLSHNHGMRETTAQEISGPDGGPMEVTQTKIVLVDPDD